MLEPVYQWLGGLAERGYLPEHLRHPFMIRALLASLILAPLLGSISPLVVTKRLAFFSAALGHSALAGVSVGLLFGESLDRPYAGVFGFSIAMALAVTFLRHRSGLPADTVIGVFLSFSLGLGICLLVAVTQRFDIHQVEAVLFGSIVTVTDLDLLILLAVAVLTAVLILPIFNDLFLASLDPDLAHSRGVRVVRNEYVFMITLTLVVVASIKVTGALLVEALVIVPAAAAKNISRGLKSYFLWSAALAWIGTQMGVLWSHQWYGVPPGAAIVLVLTILFVVTFSGRLLREWWARKKRKVVAAHGGVKRKPS
jgi:zinc transport system permease protein